MQSSRPGSHFSQNSNLPESDASWAKVLVPLHAHCNIALHSEIDRVDVLQQTTAKQLLLSAMVTVEFCMHTCLTDSEFCE